MIKETDRKDRQEAQIKNKSHEPALHDQKVFKINQGYLCKVLNDQSLIIRKSIPGTTGLCFQHININNNTFRQRQSFDVFESFIIISDHEILFLQSSSLDKCSYLILWNIEKNETATTKINSYKNFQGMVYFKDTQIVCYWCIQSFGNSMQLIFYEHSDLSAGAAKPFHCYEYYEFKKYARQSFNHEKIPGIFKLNETSTVVLIGRDLIINQHKIFIATYNLNIQNKTGELKTIKFDANQTLNPEKLDFISARVKDVWEAEPNMVYIQIETFVNIQRYKKSLVKEFFKQNEHDRYHTFYYSLNQNKSTIGKINIAYPHKLQFINRLRGVTHKQIEHLDLEQQLQRSHVPRTIGVPIYYTDPKGEAILSINQPINNRWDQRYQWLVDTKDRMYKISRDYLNQMTFIFV